jgi:hypothetical protein
LHPIPLAVSSLVLLLIAAVALAIGTGNALTGLMFSVFALYFYARMFP